MSNIVTILTAVFLGVALIAFSLWIGNREYEEWKEARRKRQRNMSLKERQLDDARDDLFSHEFEMRFLIPPHPTDPMDHMQRCARLEHERLVNRVRDAEKEVYGEPITPKAEDWRSLP